MFTEFDGSGRTPRDVQKQALDWIESHKDDKFINLMLPTSSGKTAIAIAIVKAFPDKQVCIVCPNNTLVQQYVSEYNLPFLIGKKHMEAETRAEVRDQVLNDRISFITNSAWLLHNKLGKWSTPVTPDIVILDEVDQIINYSRNEQNVSFPVKTDNPFVVKDLLAKDGEMQFEKAVFNHAMKYGQNYFLDYREESTSTFLHYTFLDGLVAKALQGGETTVLMSATLSGFDLKELVVPAKYNKIFDGEHPIPEDRRPVIWTPKSDHFDQTIAELALDIVALYNEKGRKNTLVHVTYEDQKILYPILRDMLGDVVAMNEANKDSKIASVRRLESRGDTLWLGAGVSEGLNLQFDLCRLQVIPRLIFPSIVDEFVQKRMALPDGSSWYQYQSIRHLIQAAGRCCRNPTDYGETYVFDARLEHFLSVWRKMKLVPKWFNVRR